MAAGMNGVSHALRVRSPACGLAYNIVLAAVLPRQARYTLLSLSQINFLLFRSSVCRSSLIMYFLSSLPSFFSPFVLFLPFFLSVFYYLAEVINVQLAYRLN